MHIKYFLIEMKNQKYCNNIILAAAIFLALSVSVAAASNTVTFRVTDSSGGQLISGAFVYVKDNFTQSIVKYGSTANGYVAFYNLSVSNYTAFANASGYGTSAIAFSVSESISIYAFNVSLAANQVPMPIVCGNGVCEAGENSSCSDCTGDYYVTSKEDLIEDIGSKWKLYDHDTNGAAPYYSVRNIVYKVVKSGVKNLSFNMGGSDWRALRVYFSPNGTIWGSVAKDACCYGTGQYFVDAPSYSPFYAKFELNTGSCCGQNSYITMDKALTLKTQDPKSVIVTYPNGGETFYKGNAMQIKWLTANVVSPQCAIDLYISGTDHSVLNIAANYTSNNYSWNIPNNLSDGNYKILFRCVEAGGSTTYSDMSDNYFSIINTPTSPSLQERINLVFAYYKNKSASGVNVNWEYIHSTINSVIHSNNISDIATPLPYTDVINVGDTIELPLREIYPNTNAETNSTSPPITTVIVSSNETGAPVIIPENNAANNTVYVCDGCSKDGKCYPIGYRLGGEYCTPEKNFTTQLPSDASCENSFECGSNVCASGKCISGDLLQMIISWFKRLFGIA